MRYTSLAASLLGAMLVISLPGTPAQALNSISWISGVGSDFNPRSRTAPCQTLAFALTQTAGGGEIIVLDSDTFSGSTISQAVTIVNQSGVAVAVDAIVVQAGASDVVTLRGLDIGGVPSGEVGINFISGAALHVENCRISHNTAGIVFEPSGTSQLFMSDTVVSDSGGEGILIRPNGAGIANVVLERVQAVNNAFGIVASASGSGGAGTVVNIAVRDSVASGNGSAGIQARSQVGGPNVIMTLDHVAATSNGNGIEADGSNMGAGGIALSNTQVSGNGQGLLSVNSGVLLSFQNNYVIGNGTDGTPTATRAPF